MVNIINRKATNDAHDINKNDNNDSSTKINQIKSSTLNNVDNNSNDEPKNLTQIKKFVIKINDYNDNEWPIDERELYKIALNFLKENQGKAFQPSYDQRNLLVALTLQEKYGKFNPDKARPLGALDFVGHDRRNAWIALQELSSIDARKQFLELLDQLCPFFRSYLIAVKCDIEEKRRKQIEMDESQRKKLEEQKRLQEEEELHRKEKEKQLQYEKQKHVIKELLNRQTINQFQTYARQQYPDSIELQEQLIKQLQEQHFQQYLEQMMMEQQTNGINNNNDNSGDNGIEQSLSLLNQTFQNNNSNIEMADNLEKLSINGEEKSHDKNDSSIKTSEKNGNDVEDEISDDEEEEDDDDDEHVISKQINAASMWTRKDLVEFKESVQAEGGHGIIKIGHGEIATIRVPTHDDGSCIFWEFATDYYDIGFGLFFEWNSTPDSQVSVYFSESEDDEDDDDELPEHNSTTGHDIEKGTNRLPNSIGSSSCQSNTNDNHSHSLDHHHHHQHPPISAIIPIYRRDSHEEVFAGNHVYPGKGVYLLKFDNSYSLWRSKTLYYRVYYTKES